jgi:hypothetical protein
MDKSLTRTEGSLTLHREVLAQKIVNGVGALLITLKEMNADIALLWAEFDRREKGGPILGCATKKEFCDRHLHRTPRAVRYMLEGGNPDNRREEIISPHAPLPIRAFCGDYVLMALVNTARQLSQLDDGGGPHDPAFWSSPSEAQFMWQQAELHITGHGREDEQETLDMRKAARHAYHEREGCNEFCLCARVAEYTEKVGDLLKRGLTAQQIAQKLDLFPEGARYYGRRAREANLGTTW